MIKLGSTVKDKTTEFTGIAVSRTEHLYSSPRVAVQSKALHEGVPKDPYWFDEKRLEEVQEKSRKIGITKEVKP